MAPSEIVDDGHGRVKHVMRWAAVNLWTEYRPDGYYWRTEISSWIGPFPTREIAKKAKVQPADRSRLNEETTNA